MIMKLRFLNRSHSQRETFIIKQNRFPHFLKIWHYHSELELVVIQESVGTRFVGDSIQKFEPNDVVLIGKNLPHMWLNDDIYFEKDSNLFADALSIHFKEDFLGKTFLELPVTKAVADLFKNARRGVRFLDLDFSIADAIKAIMAENNEFSKLLKMLELINQLAIHSEIELLASEGYLNVKMEDEVDKTHEYIFKNFTKPIQLAEVAAIAKMNTSAFSRYFKRIHRKTFSRYLIEIRISYACKLLMENNMNISTICYQSGFNNISNFNRQFKKIKGINPSEYMRLYE